MPSDLTVGALPNSLLGKRILVVEDDHYLAAELSQDLVDLGATVLGPAPTPYYALGLLGRRGADAGILDVRLHRTNVFDVAEELISRNIPIIFATAARLEDLPAQYQGFPFLGKPLDRSRLHAALKEIFSASELEKAGPGPVRPPPETDALMKAIARALRGAQVSGS